MIIGQPYARVAVTVVVHILSSIYFGANVSGYKRSGGFYIGRDCVDKEEKRSRKENPNGSGGGEGAKETLPCLFTDQLICPPFLFRKVPLLLPPPCIA